MKSFKVVFFNPVKVTKRVYRFVFRWDYNNHCWEVTTISLFGESTRRYSGEPINLINHAKECLVKRDEYITVKCA